MLVAVIVPALVHAAEDGSASQETSAGGACVTDQMNGRIPRGRERTVLLFCGVEDRLPDVRAGIIHLRGQALSYRRYV